MMLQRYSDEFKRDAIALVREGGRIQDVANQLGIPRGTLWGWVRKVESVEFRAPPIDTGAGDLVDADTYHAALQRIAELEEESDILLHAAVYFARALAPSTPPH